MNENACKKLDFLTPEALALLVLINQGSLASEPCAGLITKILVLSNDPYCLTSPY